MTNGQQYLVQLFANDSRSNGRTERSTVDGTKTLLLNTGTGTGGLGQYLTDTFAASGTTQTFTYANAGGQDVNLLSAIQVCAVPGTLDDRAARHECAGSAGLCMEEA